MAKSSSKSSNYSNERRLVNKKKKQDKRELKLEKRKEWRIKKYAEKKLEEISNTTRRLLKKWTKDDKYNRKSNKL